MPYEEIDIHSRIGHWRFDESSGFETEESVAGKKDPIEFALRKGRYQSPVAPIRRQGIRGNALLFDGYSTYIRRAASDFGKPVDSLTITAWIAPRTFGRGEEEQLSPIINQHNKGAAQGYIFGLFRDGAWSLQIGFGTDWHEVWSHERKLPRNTWSFVAAVYDRSASIMRLYLNGEEVASKRLEKALSIAPCDTDVMIGRNNQAAVLAEAFRMNHFDGLMDELVIYNRSLDVEQLRTIYNSYLTEHQGSIPKLPPDDLNEIRKQRVYDRHRPVFHLTPPAHWMNEPHGPLFFEGQYHLFYQYNPQGPFWNHIHWGHWVSEDLVHWRDLPPAIYPDNEFDCDGIWSGSASLDASGNPVLFYTTGNFSKFPTQAVGLAYSNYPSDGDQDLKLWWKHPTPIIEQAEGQGLYGEFRDPFVWQEDGVWYMLVGTGTKDGNGGTADVYTSEGDMTAWTYRGPLLVSNYEKYPYLGVMWELPVLLPLPLRTEEGYIPSGKHILLICPWGEGAKVEVNYWIGTWDRERFRFNPDHDEPGLIDVGDFHFTGPSGMTDPLTERALLFTIAQGERTPEIDYDCGWSHTAGLPVSLYLRPEGGLGVEPIEEIQQLRGRKLLQAEGKLQEVNDQLSQIEGDLLEIRLTFEKTDANRYGIALRRTPDGEEETLLYYDHEQQRLAVNREKSTIDPAERTGGEQGGPMSLGADPLQWIIYVDRSLIECYANGSLSLTTRTYPSRSDAMGLKLWADGEIEHVCMEVWEMTPAFLYDGYNT